MIYLIHIINILRPKLEQICPNLKLRQNWNLLLNPVLSSVLGENPDSVTKLKSKLPKLPETPIFTRVLRDNPVCIKTPISKDIGEPLGEFSISLEKKYGVVNFLSTTKEASQ